MKHLNSLKYLLFTILILNLSLITSTNHNEDTNAPLNFEEQSEIEKGLKQLLNFLNYSEQTSSNPKFKGNVAAEGIICRSCKYIQGKIHSFLLQKYGVKYFFQFGTYICTFFYNYDFCSGIPNEFGDIGMTAVINRFFDPDIICSGIWACQNVFVKMTTDDFAKDLLKDKPVNLTLPQINSFSGNWKVLHIADIHTDMEYHEGSWGSCDSALCCRQSSGEPKNPTEAAGKWGYVGKCDLPKRTLLNFLDAVANDIKPDFIIWTGDNAPHNVWQDTKHEIVNITGMFIELVQLKFNNTIPVYPAVGNHEQYPNDQYNPFNRTQSSSSWFLKTMADFYEPFLTSEAYRSFASTGYYSMLHPNSNLRIISMNCLLCDTFNLYLYENPTDPSNQISWLVNTLKKAEKNNEVVFIIGHIPPANQFYLSECAKRYNAIADRFSHVIRGHFYGHTHYDEFQMVREYFNKEKTTAAIFVAPSLTTFPNYHPSFRVFDIDSDTKLLKDYSQYRMNLTEANSHPDKTPEWKVAYKATDAFNVTDLQDYEGFNNWIAKIKTDPKVLKDSVTWYLNQGPGVEKTLKSSYAPLFMTCRYSHNSFNDYLKCTGIHTSHISEYFLGTLDLISGSWYEKITPVGETVRIEDKSEVKSEVKSSNELKFLN